LFLFNLLLQTIFSGDQVLAVGDVLKNIFDSISQLMFVMFAPLLGYLFGHDIEKKHYLFYNNIGVSFRKYLTLRRAMISALCILTLSLFLLVYTLFAGFPVADALLVLLFLSLEIIYMINVSASFALITSKFSTTAIILILYPIIMNIVNILPIGPLKGLLFLSDKNSYTEHVFSIYFSSSSGNMNFKDSAPVNASTFLILFCMHIFWIVATSLIVHVLITFKHGKKTSSKLVASAS
jgi:hypothetical protein